VTLDELVTLEDGKTYGVTFRVPDDARSITFAVEPGTTGPAITWRCRWSAISAWSRLATLFAFGETGQERPTIASRASRISKTWSRLTLVDDAPAIATADQGAIPAYDPNVTIPPDPFTLPPRDLRYLEVIDGQGHGVRALVRLAWQLPRFGKTVPSTSRRATTRRRSLDAGRFRAVPR
jgi:hypothetical protein